MNLNSRRTFAIPALIVLSLIGFRSASANAIHKSSKVPSDLTAFTSRVRDLLTAKDAAAISLLAAKPETFKWLEQRTFRGQTDWKLDTLSIQGSPSLAVFHDFHTCESIGDHIHTIVKTPEGLRFGAEVKESDSQGFRVRDHKLTVKYELANASCKITDDVQIERTDPKATTCLIRLSADMQVDTMTLDGKPATAKSVPGAIVLTAPKSPKFTLHLAYHGTVNHPGSDYIKAGETVLCSYWYPHIGRLPAKHGVTAIVPSGWTAVGQGELIKRVETGGNVTFSFRNEIPTCFFTLDAGPYVITSRMVGGRKLSVYELKPIPGRAQRSLDSLEKCLTWFEKNFGAYPYTHYEVVETLGPFSGALEAYSFSTYDRGAFGAVVHEVSHTWWGGIVPCPYTKSMWNESFASYCDGLFNRQTGAQKPVRALTNQHRGNSYGRNMVRGFAVPVGEAYDTSNGSHAAAGYGKGSLVLSMLEDLLGTETMIRSMRQFNSDHRQGEAAEWPDFQRAVNKVTGKDYTWFFDQWVNRGGVPLVKLANVQKKEESGGYVITGEVVQEGSPYRLAIPIVIRGEGDNSSAQVVEVTGTSTPFRLEVKFAPKSVVLDPAGNILMGGAKTEDEKADPFTVGF
jgi:aminopeptidase N